MNIAIDGRLLSGRITGIGRFLLNILQFLPEFDNNNKYHLYTYEDTEFKNSFYLYTYIKKRHLPKQLQEHFWLNFILPKLLEKHKIDVFFTPYVLVPASKGNYKKVIAIHDAIPMACKNSYSFKYRTYMNIMVHQCIKRSDAVLTVSESSKSEIIKYYNADPVKINVMHLWTDSKYHPRKLKAEEVRNLLDKYHLPDKFALYVGAMEDRKNISGIIRISDILESKGYHQFFVLVGKKGFGYGKIKAELESRKKRFIHIEMVNENDLPLLYNTASLFIFPTSYEGFGLPPLEAMKSGIPILTSNNTSLPEVVGSGGIMLSKDDYQGFADYIVKLSSDNSFYCSMSEKALKQAEEFTPEKQLPKLVRLFNNITSAD